MIKLVGYIVGSILVVCFSISSMAYNPCNVNDCTHVTAERLVATISVYAAEIKSIREVIESRDSKLSVSDITSLKTQAEYIHSEATYIFRNFSKLLGISDSATQVTVAKRYSAQLWNAHHKSESEKQGVERAAIMSKSRMAGNKSRFQVSMN